MSREHVCSVCGKTIWLGEDRYGSGTLCQDCQVLSGRKPMSYEEQMAAWVELLGKQPKTLYDFGWYLEPVPEPNDERKRNK